LLCGIDSKKKKLVFGVVSLKTFFCQRRYV